KRAKNPSSMADLDEKIRASNLVFLNQTEPLGFGDAVLRGRTVIKGPFLVQAADTFILSEGDGYLERLAQAHRKYGASATILLRDVPHPDHYGVVEGDPLEPGILTIRSAAKMRLRRIGSTRGPPMEARSGSRRTGCSPRTCPFRSCSR